MTARLQFASSLLTTSRTSRWLRRFVVRNHTRSTPKLHIAGGGDAEPAQPRDGDVGRAAPEGGAAHGDVGRGQGRQPPQPLLVSQRRRQAAARVLRLPAMAPCYKEIGRSHEPLTSCPCEGIY
jgi:hypothetical protein